MSKHPGLDSVGFEQSFRIRVVSAFLFVICWWPEARSSRRMRWKQAVSTALAMLESRTSLPRLSRLRLLCLIYIREP